MPQLWKFRQDRLDNSEDPDLFNETEWIRREDWKCEPIGLCCALIVLLRGWHLDEAHILVGGRPVSVKQVIFVQGISFLNSYFQNFYCNKKLSILSANHDT